MQHSIDGPVGNEVTESLRYAVVGVGDMGREHLRNITAIPGGEVVAVADPHEPSVDQALRVAPGPRVFAAVEDLMAHVQVDVLVVATPNHTHRAVVERIVERSGAFSPHLLLEKPLCTTTEDCRHLERLLDGYPAVTWVGMAGRYSPPVATLIKEVERGVTGTPRMVSIREHRRPFSPKVGNWNRFARHTGGTLVEKCCHFFDLMRYILGDEPSRVIGSGGRDVNHLDERYGGEQPDILDNAYVIVDFAAGARASLDLCMFAEQSRHQTEIVVSGTAGQVEVGLPEGVVWVGERELPWRPEARREPDRIRTIDVQVDEAALRLGAHHGATWFQHLAFQRAVRDGRAPGVGIRDGLMAVAMGQAAERSVSQGRPVMMEEVLGPP